MQQNYGPGQYSAGYPYMYGQPAQNGAGYPSTPGPATPFPMRRPQHSRAIPPGSTAQYAIAPSNDPAAYEETPRLTRSRHHERHVSGQGRNPQLKSAMKKSAWTTVDAPQENVRRSRTVPANETSLFRRNRGSGVPVIPDAREDLQRRRTLSDPMKGRANSLSRPRSRSDTWRHHTPDHLIVSFHGTNRLKLSSLIYQVTVDTIRERVLPMWPPGVEYQTYKNERNEYTIEFGGDPWTAQGSVGSLAQGMILELFAVLAQQGYYCTATINSGLSLHSPRLVFSLASSDPSAEFFMIAFSGSRRKMKLINSPDFIGQSLSEILREAFPRRITTANWDEENIYRIEFSRVGFDNSFDLITAEILQFAHTHGYNLEASIPLARSGLLGLVQGRREIWIFRRLQSQYRRKSSGT